MLAALLNYEPTLQSRVPGLSMNFLAAALEDPVRRPEASELRRATFSTDLQIRQAPGANP